MPLRKLVLKKESLAELTTGELLSIAGGAPLTPNCPTKEPLCYTVHDLRCFPSQIMYPCVPTGTCTNYC
ncbi:MAG TPA: hypothetical protein VNA20_14115 [Frankiaceae bacterium]|nr:hypothetical protein [Frankiaceae bacterium]